MSKEIVETKVENSDNISRSEYITKLIKKLEEKEKIKLVMENQYFQILGQIDFLKKEIEELKK